MASKNDLVDIAARLLAILSIDERVDAMLRGCELSEARSKGGSVVKLRLVKREQET
jgi:hypothetical protein